MSTRTAAPALTALLRAADRLQVEIPDTLRGRIEAAVNAVRAAGDVKAQAPDLTALIADAIGEGRDPMKDKRVRDAAVDHTILTACGPNAITAALEQRASVVAHDNGAAILAAFKPRYAELGRLLTEDCATLSAAGVDDLDHARLSVRAGTDPARAHARALETISTLAAIDNALAQLRAYIGSDDTPVGRVVRNVDAPDVAASDLRKLGLNPSHWQIVQQGWTLDLATPAEAKARYARAYDLQAGHERATAQAGVDAIRTRYGTGRPINV